MLHLFKITSSLLEFIDLISNIGEKSKDRSDNSLSRSTTEDADTDLKELLKTYKLTNLYAKFKEMGVTTENFWDIEEEDLLEHEFSKFERKRINKAKAIYEKQNPTRQGKII